MGIIEIKKLNSFKNFEGELFETLRSDDSLFSTNFGQNLVSLVKPGIIKGLHLHDNQTDYTTCIKGNILYVAIKDGKNLQIETHQMGEDYRILIKTPPKIWHGYMPLDNKEAIVLYTMDKPYDPKNPDTLEKDPYSFGDLWHNN